MPMVGITLNRMNSTMSASMEGLAHVPSFLSVGIYSWFEAQTSQGPGTSAEKWNLLDGGEGDSQAQPNLLHGKAGALS